jgi:hypothetical protein
MIPDPSISKTPSIINHLGVLTGQDQKSSNPYSWLGSFFNFMIPDTRSWGTSKLEVCDIEKDVVAKTFEDASPSSYSSWRDCPKDILIEIFKHMTSFNDILSLFRVNKQWKIAATVYFGDQKLLKLKIPPFIRQATDSKIRNLPQLKMFVLAASLERKFLSNEDFKVLFNHHYENNDKKIYYPKAVIGDYLAIADSEQCNRGVIEIHPITTHSAKSELIRVHETAVLACLGLSFQETELKEILVTVDQSNLKIWDIKQLAKTTQTEPLPLIDHKIGKIAFSKPFAKCKEDAPVVKAYDHLVGIATKEKIILIDCRRLSDSKYFTTIEFEGATQIELTDSHVMFVSSNRVAIWEKTKILEAIEESQILNLKSASYIISPENDMGEATQIGFAQLLQTDLLPPSVLLSYKIDATQQSSEATIGEFRLLSAFNDVKKLTIKVNTSSMERVEIPSPYAVATQGASLIIASDRLRIWDDAMQPKYRELEYTTYCLNPRVYAIGQAILFAMDNYLIIIKDLSLASLIFQQRTEEMKLKKAIDNNELHSLENPLTSFKLDGKQLLTESSGPVSNAIKIFDSTLKAMKQKMITT